MTAIDKDALLNGIGGDDPCGEDLEYDAAFGALERLAQIKPEQQFGDTIIPAEEPDWRVVRQAAIDLFARTKDLRVGVHLAKALIRTDGYAGFADAIAVIKTLIVDHWDGVHPQLDPDDDNDPTMRVNTLISLCDADGVLRGLRDAPLVASARLGRFSLRDLQIAAGELAAPADSDRPSPDEATINGAFMDVSVEDLQATAAAIDQALGDVTEIESTVTGLVGTAHAPNLEALRAPLGEAKSVLAERLSRRGVVPSQAEADSAESPPPAPVAAAQTALPVQRIAGEITSRDDVTKMLDKIIGYYDRYEPSSPVPLLINRAKRMVSMNFLEILRELAPDGVKQAELVGGMQESAQQKDSSDW